MEEFIQRLESKARTAIVQSFHQSNQYDAVHLFIQHHIDEIAPEYWKQLLATTQPTPQQVLDLLVLNPYMEWEFEEEEETYMVDFTLPEDVTQYVLCVELDHDENLINISMES